MRLDLLLVRLRFVQSRSLAQEWIGKGRIRRNRRRVTKAGQPVATGDVLTLPMRTHMKVIEILALPKRRGPATEAQEHYRVLDDGAPFAIAGRQRRGPRGHMIEGPSAP